MEGPSSQRPPHVLAVLNELQPCTPPQVLRLSSCERVSDAGVRALCLGPAARSLEDLNLSDCDRLTDRAAAAVGAHLRRLRLLSLEHCHRVGDRCTFFKGSFRLVGFYILVHPHVMRAVAPGHSWPTHGFRPNTWCPIPPTENNAGCHMEV